MEATRALEHFSRVTMLRLQLPTIKEIEPFFEACLTGNSIICNAGIVTIFV